MLFRINLFLLATAFVTTCVGVPVRLGRSDDQDVIRDDTGDRDVIKDDVGTTDKTMIVRGHQVSEVSSRWTGKVVYAIFTSAIERFHDKLLAELETWARRPAFEGRFVAVGGKNYPAMWQRGNILKSECEDDKRSISCKEATLLAEGAARGADWLVVLGEDNYVHTSNVEKFLSTQDPTQAVAHGVIGCGMGAFCHDNADFEQYGGFCGGCGYIISRAALQRLLAEGVKPLHAIYDNTKWPNDMTTTCQLRKHNVTLKQKHGMHGFPMFFIEDYEKMAASNFLTAHYLTPAGLRYMQGQLDGTSRINPWVRQKLEYDAFDKGCARGLNRSFWADNLDACRKVKGRRTPLPKPNFLMR